MYLLVVPWTQKAYVCVVDTAKVNQLPNLETQYSRQHSKYKALSTNSTAVPTELTFETRVETDVNVARRVVQRWLTSANQERHQQMGEHGGTAPVILLLHAPHNTQNQTAAASSSLEAPWPLGDQITGRRRTPQLSALSEMPVVPLGGTREEAEGREEGQENDDAYSILNWQQTVIKRGIKFFLQVGWFTHFVNFLILCRCAFF